MNNSEWYVNSFRFNKFYKLCILISFLASISLISLIFLQLFLFKGTNSNVLIYIMLGFLVLSELFGLVSRYFYFRIIKFKSKPCSKIVVFSKIAFLIPVINYVFWIFIVSIKQRQLMNKYVDLNRNRIYKSIIKNYK
ncbi:hypothetical protein SCHIN_v1c03290 [Spiroplasma chinense]|uniref:Uncharacterized protein n=1 Tax=Spiroplasma chinense TaxID=216932 RepID=A0A5B9Y4C6_9MOLU|nr:hypothetical protein [Spiroplasma chinense]QEH61526.1 hypothetical protein SCHIN_v1c03290 [Spiroplasma chinense]